MKYEIISADSHIDLIWLPPDLFTGNAAVALRERMPHVVDEAKGPLWVTRGGAQFGLMNGMGSAGREYIPGQIHRSDRMAAAGLYEDGQRGIRRLTEPGLRVKDQDLDGVRPDTSAYPPWCSGQPLRCISPNSRCRCRGFSCRSSTPGCWNATPVCAW